MKPNMHMHENYLGAENTYAPVSRPSPSPVPQLASSSTTRRTYCENGDVEERGNGDIIFHIVLSMLPFSER